MTDRIAACPDAETLAAFVDGRLPATDRTRVGRHLTHCTDCLELVAEVTRTVAAMPPEVTPATWSVSSRWWWLSGAAAAVILAAVAWQGLPGRARRLDATVVRMASLSGEMRATEARLGIDAPYGPPPSATRSAGSETSLPADVLALLAEVRQGAAGATDARALTALGRAELLTGRVDVAIGRLSDALAASPGYVDAHVALSAAYFERWRSHGRDADLGRALDEAELALAAGPSSAARFNRALTLEALGLRDDAIAAWQAVLDEEAGTPWAIEAAEHLARLREAAGAASLAGLASALDGYLQAWAATPDVALPPEALRLATSIESAGGDLVLPALARAIPSAAGTIRLCLADAVTARLKGTAAFDVSDYTAATDWQERAARAARCAGLNDAGYRADIAWSRFNDGHYDLALADADDIERAAMAAGHWRGAARVTHLRGRMEHRRAHMADALRTFRTAAERAETAGDADLVATIASMEAETFGTAGDEARAWASHARALRQWPDLSPRRRHIAVVGALLTATAFHRDGAALRLAAILDRNSDEWGVPHGRASAGLSRAQVFHRRGDGAAVERALEDTRAAIAELAALGEDRLRYEADLALVEAICYTPHDPHRAVASLDRGADLITARGFRLRLPQIMLWRARAHEAAGDLEAARLDLDAGLAVFEDERPAVRDAQLSISRFDQQWDLFGESIRLTAGDPVASLAMSERSRARELLDSLSRARTPMAPLAGSALYDWLPADVTVVAFSTLDDRLFRWDVTSRGVALAARPTGRDEVSRLVDQHVAAVRAGHPSPAGTALASLIVPEGLDASTIAFVPDGPLHRLPFASLPLADGTRLVDRVTALVAPSLTVLRSTGRVSGARGMRAAVIGYGASRPDLGLVALPAVTDEVRHVAALYPGATVLIGSDATPARVLAAMADADVVHVASHAVVDEAFPGDSRLFVAPAADHTGELRAGDLSVRRLRPGAIVVLSACETLAGRVYRGEGSMALARPFLAAGASAVVASLWPVGDRDALAVARAIHERLASGESAGQAVAGALRTGGNTNRAAMAFQVWGGGSFNWAH